MVTDAQPPAMHDLISSNKRIMSVQQNINISRRANEICRSLPTANGDGGFRSCFTRHAPASTNPSATNIFYACYQLLPYDAHSPYMDIHAIQKGYKNGISAPPSPSTKHLRHNNITFHRLAYINPFGKQTTCLIYVIHDPQSQLHRRCRSHRITITPSPQINALGQLLQRTAPTALRPSQQTRASSLQARALMILRSRSRGSWPRGRATAHGMLYLCYQRWRERLRA